MHEEILMLNLIGEQPAPNLLPIYELKPQRVILIATDKTRKVADRLTRLLRQKGYFAQTIEGDAYNIKITYQKVLDIIKNENKNLIANFTGGTKPMVLALVNIARKWQFSKMCYFRTEKSQGTLYFYDPHTFNQLGEPQRVQYFITLDDYLLAHVDNYTERGPAQSEGGDFERAIAKILKDRLDEVKIGVKIGGALEIDLIFRCGNQVGIAEVKTGKKAKRKEGIDQLNTAGAREYLGIYIKKFLIVDTEWEEQLSHLNELAQAHNITVVSLPSYSKNKKIDLSECEKLVNTIRSTLHCGE